MTVAYPYSALITHRQGADTRFVVSYYGSQALTSFPSEVMLLIEKAPQYVDITSGGGGMVYARAALGQSVAANDRCTYAAWTLSAALTTPLQPNVSREDWFEQFCESIHPSNVTPCAGYLTAQQAEPKPKPRLNLVTAGYLDALLMRGDTFLTAAVGQACISLLSYHALGWSQTTIKGVQTVDLEPITLFVSIGRFAWRIRCALEKVQHSPSRQVTNMHALDALTATDGLELLPGALVYTDPAWPWGPQLPHEANPYAFFTNAVSSVLRQQKVTPTSFWPATDATPIYADLHSWITAAFTRGASYFVLSTQSTNFPHPNDLEAWCREHFKVDAVYLVEAKSIHAVGKRFGEWFCVLKG